MDINFKFVSIMCERERSKREGVRERSFNYKLVDNMIPDCELLTRLQIHLYAMLYSKNN